MPYRRTFRKRTAKRPYRRRMIRRATRRPQRSLGAFKSGVLHNFRRWGNAYSYGINGGTALLDVNTGSLEVTVPAGNICRMAFNFLVSQCSGWLEFASLFEYVKLNGVSTHITYKRNTAGTESGVQDLPVMYYARDYNDAIPPTTLPLFKERNQTKLYNFGIKNTKSIYLKPALDNTENVQLIGRNRNPWIEVNAAGFTPLNGLKLVFHNSAALPVVFTINTRYYIQFKQPV